jgi:hypothetical protein
VARAASRGVAAVAAEEAHEEDEEEGGALSLYEEELGLEEEDEEQDASTGAKVKRTFRSLGNKEKKELRAYAHQLGHDICMHQVGQVQLSISAAQFQARVPWRRFSTSPALLTWFMSLCPWLTGREMGLNDELYHSYQ